MRKRSSIKDVRKYRRACADHFIVSKIRQVKKKKDSEKEFCLYYIVIDISDSSHKYKKKHIYTYIK